MSCFPQYNCAHQNFTEKLCPESDGVRAAPAPKPLRTQRLTPLAFATPRTPIYCENTGIRALPYFQTGTLSHACHVTNLFKCELPLAYVGLHHICISIILRKAIMPCFPQYNCAHQNFTEKLCPELDGVRAAPAPKPLRTQRLTPLAFATPRTPIAHLLTFKLAHCPTPATWLTYSSVSYLLLMWAYTTSASALYCEKLLWATSWLLYHWTELLWATSWLLYHLTELLWATSWLLYHLTKLLWATSWLLYHLTELLWATIDWATIDWATIDWATID